MKRETANKFFLEKPAINKSAIAREAGMSKTLFFNWLAGRGNMSYRKRQAVLIVLLKYGFKCEHDWRAATSKYIGHKRCRYCGLWK